MIYLIKVLIFITSDFKYKDLVKLKNVNFYAIYTNPNKSRVRIDKKIIDGLSDPKYVVTASTGTNHIEKITQTKNIKLPHLLEILKQLRHWALLQSLHLLYT